MGLLVRSEVEPGAAPRMPFLMRIAQKALVEAVQEVASSIEEKGRADIGSAGNFGARWTEGFVAEVSDNGDSVDLDVTESAPFWQVFQNGATIVGKPLLYFKPSKPPTNLKPGAPMPLLIAKHSVTIPKKFHLVEIATAEVEKVPDLFAAKLGEATAE